jgi:RimJ/RimL family protein N-acetyltransferase
MLPPPKSHRHMLELGYFVLPSCRREGVATHMVQDAQSQLPQLKAERGIGQISLEIQEANSASLAMAHKLGFKEKGRYPSDHPLSEEGERNVHFVYSAQRKQGRTGR